MDPQFPVLRRALLSVSDKSGLIDLARALHERRVEIVATGGTARALEQAGIPILDVSDVTEFPEMMDGRLKTLHPRIHGGLLARRNNPVHRKDMSAHGIEGIDLLVVNLYPFEKTLERNAGEEELIENIDIGGPAMIRAAAKNHEHVCVVTSPREYPVLLAELQVHDGSTGLAFRRHLAALAFRRTALYDAAISGWMASPDDEMPSLSPSAGILSHPLRYGENPHQRAALYLSDEERAGAACAKLLQGKPPSYNNLLDADAAFELIAEFDAGNDASVAIIKHGIPCGVATRPTVAEAYVAALACDPVSAFGGVVASNRSIDRAAAGEIVKHFTELVIAPGAEEDAVALFAQKPDLRVLATGSMPSPEGRGFAMRSIAGGLLVQSRDDGRWNADSLQTVTKRTPGEQEWRDLRFAFHVCKHVKSNAIVVAKESVAVGIGGGQVSRVDAVEQAVRKAGGETLQGGVLASDGFFPFPDGIEKAGASGVRAVVQPGGSKRDDEVITAADALDIAMVFTGVRQFRH
ncbi:MAG: bifunctional phosphoribosylaminoimidazolecarboxamide formyltransferase/IMP cyclohydrolase [Hyphomicrobiales bacterium]|nr:bifunctional phosphoribosylaminoimidazolecarboxamide formyltransferase/IMP cyclohydrolase [Hyphomicrobiales bacterium]